MVSRYPPLYDVNHKVLVASLSESPKPSRVAGSGLSFISARSGKQAQGQRKPKGIDAFCPNDSRGRRFPVNLGGLPDSRLAKLFQPQVCLAPTWPDADSCKGTV